MGRSRSRGGGGATSGRRRRSPSGGRARSRSMDRRLGASQRVGSAGSSRNVSAADMESALQSAKKPQTADLRAKPLKTIRKSVFSQELGYKDDSNPFGDSSLTDKFVWKKKNEYLQAAGLYRKSSKDQDVDRIEAKVREIHQVKKRRDEREVERKLLEKQRLEHDRERHDEEYQEWLDKEDKFHLDNAKARSMLRIDQGRERPIDLIAKGLAIAGGEDFEDMTILETQPHQLFVQMTLDEIEDMVPDIANFVRNDTEHKSFWKAMQYVCKDAIDSKQREKGSASRSGAPMGGLGAGVADGVVSEIHDLLCSKSVPELEEMLAEIKSSVNKGSAGMDTQFFDAVASKIPLYIARSVIEDWHNRAKKRSDAANEAKAQRERDLALAGVASEDEEEVVRKPAAGASFQAPMAGVESDDDLSPALEPLDALDDSSAHIKGAYSPVLEPLNAYDPDDLLDPVEDEALQKQVIETLIEAFCGPAHKASSSSGSGLDRSAEDKLVEAERRKGMDSGEVAFNAAGKGSGDDFHGEISLPTRNYDWEDKYRPRKPRFFNRVKTGYEWNKYNQTHYDHDNPPPKMVQGYKFNVFYPDLIDKTKAPNYYLEKDPTSEETCILRFHAGPPYEDVAFKIVNREWNLSTKFGFRVVFDRGVLQLYFNFKRWRYRR
eukprot:TRINITY_DN73090_c0_g1_i1.p1 TRINITY_DN73090_c0_g1~~TRINITY_DN73090_c0_g1_i1.p1  ORF type:complete len:661 (-),score=175.80 TRINITY_DN73090_c0_g1_i1:71-2053(-)